MAAAYDRFVLRAGGQAVMWKAPKAKRAKVNLIAKGKVLKLWDGRKVDLKDGNIDYEYRITVEHRDGTGTYDQTFRFGQMRKEFQKSRFNKRASMKLPTLGALDHALYDDIQEMYMERSFKDFDEDLKDVTELMLYGKPVYAEISPCHGNSACSPGVPIGSYVLV
jgi:hypothetical protein